MSERILFLTGKLAGKNLHRILESMQPTAFEAVVCQLGINVAGLMTADMIRRRLDMPEGISRIIVPGRCRGDLQTLSLLYGVPVERGPEELRDLPQFFGHGEKPPDLSRYDIKIFAEIVDAPKLDIEAILQRAQAYRSQGADVIDIGCLPDTPFPHLTECVQALRDDGFKVSIDSVDSRELLTGGKAGADYLLSLREDTLWIADQVAAVPIVIPTRPGDMNSLLRAMEMLDRQGHRYLADPVLDPLLFGFTESLCRYRELRKRRPDAGILMGIGNVTELTDADTCGINALLIGIASELGITHILTTQVSPHARRAVSEVDVARRTLFLAREQNSLPRNLDDRLLGIHERRPFPYSGAEIAETAAAVRDPSYRVQVSEDGIHVYNRDGMHTGTDPFELLPALEFRNDTGHAFYMGTELARAQIAWQLGKRHTQDQELNWGCASDQDRDRPAHSPKPGCTLIKTGAES
ncbi:MAG TPA: dihydropteroate synthase [Gammaproteobacteria bacterium]|nr:dihydropteroate synthase [Gammaproteobacteria bacterium]